jgi:DNA-binding GntR family transcriptional regulator
MVLGMLQMVDATPINDFGTAGIVYREIKRRITELHHKPGDKLSEVRISTELGVGRSPVRTAFARLQSEGWIEISPWSGTFVRGLSDNEITEILETRLVLESYLAGLAAKRIGELELKRLREAFTKFGSQVSKERMDDYLELDLQFHMAIYEAAGNKLIRGILVNLIDKIRWIRRGSAGSPSRTQSAFVEICKVLEALEARDPDGATAAMRRHIASTLEFRMPQTTVDTTIGPVKKIRRGKR